MNGSRRLAGWDGMEWKEWGEWTDGWMGMNENEKGKDFPPIPPPATKILIPSRRRAFPKMEN